jgi:DNA-binding MarR family transcriptional regulator
VTDEPLWIDAETTVAERPADHKMELRLWLRLFSCSRLIENDIRRHLNGEFQFSLPRFDILAQLDRADDGLVLGEVSKRLMVSAGNITSLVEGLVKTGHITRTTSTGDRRAQVIRLTDKGRREFRRMAKVHGDWIAAYFEHMSQKDIDRLMELLATLKDSARRSIIAKQDS